MVWVVDSLIFCFIIFLAVRGYFKGFITEFGQIIGLIISVIISLSQSKLLTNMLLNKLFYDPKIIYIFSFILIFSIIIVVIRIIIKAVHLVFISNSNKWMNKFLGTMFGAIKGIIIVMIFFWLIAILPLNKWNSFIQKNSKYVIISNKIKFTLISFFDLEDSTITAESYLKRITQP